MVCVPIAFALAQAATLPTLFVQVAPTGPFVGLTRSQNQERAVVLIHGLHLHPVERRRASRPELSPWQLANGHLVPMLARRADVFAFSYAQTTSIATVGRSAGLRMGVSHLRAAGYREIVLLGFSAGGVIARQFAEENPGAVSRVVQVCAPNGGSDWARWTVGIPKAQSPFLRSLTPQARQGDLARAARTLPQSLEFVCVVGRIKKSSGDGFVRCDRQWSEDLQMQGVPAILLPFGHLEMMVKSLALAGVAEACFCPVPRWNAAAIEAGRRLILGDD